MDKRGFFFSDDTIQKYNLIKNTPHLYIAFTKHDKGYFYIGKSNQKNGRWQRGHYYHFGTLAHHILNAIKKDEQNHLHWIEAWMDINTIQINNLPFSVLLKEPVYIAFIPFNVYSGVDYSLLPIDYIKRINTKWEKDCIEYYRNQGYILLNKQNKKKKTQK